MGKIISEDTSTRPVQGNVKNVGVGNEDFLGHLSAQPSSALQAHKAEQKHFNMVLLQKVAPLPEGSIGAWRGGC